MTEWESVEVAMIKKHGIKILPEQTNLLPGESTQVQIVVTLDEPLKVRSIVAKFNGYERTLAKYTKKVNGRTKTKTAEQKHMLCSETFVLQGEDKGILSRSFNSILGVFGGGTGETLPAGEHEFSFDVFIPNDAAASFFGVKCERQYRVELRVDIPFKFDLKKNQRLRILPIKSNVETNSVHVIYPDDTGKSLLDRAFGKKVKLNLALDRDQFMPGQKVLSMLVVESDDPLEVNQIKATLCGHESSYAKFHRDSHDHRHELAEIASPEVISKESTFEFELDIPNSIDPPTGSGKHFDVKWWVEIRLDVPWAKDPTMKIPITLLDKPIS